VITAIAADKSAHKEEDMYKALCHPLRREILAYLIERSSGSPSEMAKAINAPLPDISHHAKQLVKYGAAELAEERPTRRGSAERVYRPTARVIISTEEVEKMSVVNRQVFAGQIVQKICEDLRMGFEVGSFARRSDWNLSRAVLDVDEEGLQHLLKLQERVEEEMFDIQAESVARRVESQDLPIRVSFSQLCFVKNL
jgi:DNA-binding transcriptional ArsR family regulator